jgi:beta-galactosidase/beta-glucuronidase
MNAINDNVAIATRSEHPRPDFLRDEWLNLNGLWFFEFDDKNGGEKEKWYVHKDLSQKIHVPFPYQSELSMIDSKEIHQYIWYQRQFELPEPWMGKRILLKFGAVDFYAKVWVNGIYLGDHAGGYSSFTFDITENLQHVNTIVIKVEDQHFRRNQPRGKQMWMTEPFGCWYKGFSGIWQTVWLEAVEQTYIESFKIVTDIDHRKVALEVNFNSLDENLELGIDIGFENQAIRSLKQAIGGKSVKLEINIESPLFQWNGIQLWSPETPNLYDIDLKVWNQGKCLDQVHSYFGMRKVSLEGNRFLLNNIPYYQKLILDQGYYNKGWITAENEAALKKDIEIIKKMGFNGVRKHQKIEEPLFLYWCDRMGLMVWEEMPSFYEYCDLSIQHMAREWPEIMMRDYNHPSIVTWVPFNESWGVTEVQHSLEQQTAVKSIYYLTKAFDKTRPVIDNDGWEHTETDICTIHDYEQDGKKLFEVYSHQYQVLTGAPSIMFPRYVFARGYQYKNQPVMMSEFGGIAFSGVEGWGYGSGVKSEEEFIQRLTGLFEAIQKTQYFCGYCYTQLTDVEQEKNGLLTFDRKPKIAPDIIKRLNTF